MKHVSVEELSATRITMTREEKLVRWANLVRTSTQPLVLFHGIEHMHPRDLELIPIHTYGPNAFTMAVRDPIFQAAGLSDRANLGEIMRFFEISQNELHEFTCDCGGHIGKDQMAHRLESLAAGRMYDRRRYATVRVMDWLR